MQTSATDVFVSYKAEDRARLKPLVEALEAEGFSVWWDAHIGGGTNWHEDIEDHLDAAKCVVVAWSKRSIGHDGHFVRDEARRAQRRGAYVPVCLDAVDPPLGFGEVQAVSLKGWRGDRTDHRFLALADAVRERITGEHIARRSHFGEPRLSRRAAIAGSAAAVVAAGAGGWLLLKPAPASAKRIAVMPFDNLSGDPTQAYFAEGIAEELRSSLCRVGMEVIGRASCDSVKNLDIKAAAAKLGVANILTGSFRRSPETIRVEAQLVNGSDGVEHWQQSYDRPPGDAIKIQTDIAENVASALSVALGRAERAALTLGGTADSAAQDLILQSRQSGRKSDDAANLRERMTLAEAAIARDPNYADAYVEKADMLFNLAVNYTPTLAETSNELAQAETAGRKAAALAPRLGSAHIALANTALGRIDFRNSLRQIKAALALSPTDANVLAVASQILGCLGSEGEGVRLADRGIALDPLNARLYRLKAEALIYSRRFPEAIEAGRIALKLAPKRLNAHIFIGDGLLLLGRPGEAKAEYDVLENDNPFRLSRLAMLAARTGDHAGAEQMIARLKQQTGPTNSYQYGEIFAQLGDKDRAFAEFDNAIKAKDAGLVYFKMDPFLDPIRKDPRYAALLRRLNVP